MKLNKVAAIPAIALAAGLSLAACGSVKAPVGAVTHTVTAPAAPLLLNQPGTGCQRRRPDDSLQRQRQPGPRKTNLAPAAARFSCRRSASAYYQQHRLYVRPFCQDINDGDYSGAWALGGDNIGGSDYAGWVAGYDTTVRVSLGTFSAFGSDQVQASLSAFQSDGTVKTYEGTYTVSGGVIVAANIVQTG